MIARPRRSSANTSIISAVEQEQHDRIGVRVAGRARADAVHERVAADRHRREQREADRAAVELREIAAAAQRKQEHAADQHDDADPADAARVARRRTSVLTTAVISGAVPRAIG